MAVHNHREEAVNTQLALLVSKFGVEAEAETIHKKGKSRPDVMFELRGLRVIIEGKFADQANAEKLVWGDAEKRVREGIAHIAAGCIYPATLKTTPTAKIEGVLRDTTLRFTIISETGGEPIWYAGTPAELMDSLRRSQEALVKDDIVERTALALSSRIETIAAFWAGQAGTCDRLSKILGIKIPKKEKHGDAADRRDTSAKVSALVLANAMIFQEQLSITNSKVDTLAKMSGNNIATNLQTQWNSIWRTINYVSIFQLAESILVELPSTKQTQAALAGLAEESISICSQQTALRHDLMGRIYHWLLHYAKYLGAYYTSVSAATLLMKMVMSLQWDIDYSEEKFRNFKVADLACGTGTLLMASCQALLDELIKARYKEGRSLDWEDIQGFHKILMESTIHGYDVLPSAVHLTASTLALLAPEVAFVGMNLYVMPMGIDRKLKQLGSLEFIRGDETETQISLDYSQAETVKTSASGGKIVNAKVPKTNLFVMNPPFARSVGDNLLFGSLPDERSGLQSELKKLVQQHHLSANIVAGLGSVFVATASKHLIERGRLAFILPHALVSGEAWGPTRQLIADQYHLEMVISSYDPKRFNFSENTSISEVMFIARKRAKKVENEEVRYISLARNPTSIHEALDIAGRLCRAKDVTSLADACRTIIADEQLKIAEVVDAPLPEGNDNWSGALFAQFNLFKIVHEFHESGVLKLQGSGGTAISMCNLEDLGDLGPDRKRISEGFKPSKHEYSSYKGFFGHKSEAVTTVAQEPNTNLVVWAESPRGSTYGDHLWERAGNILLAERIRFNTHRVLAVGFEVPVLGNTWWALDAKLSQKQRKALLLWLNSTISLVEFFSRRVVTQGAFVQMKQPAWQKMRVLDVRALGSEELETLAKAYDELANAPLMPLSQLDLDPTRARFDDKISEALNLPNLTPLRQLLALEPGLGIATAGSDSGDEEDASEEPDEGE